MKNRVDLRTVLLYAITVLIFLLIRFIEPYPKGTEDYYVWDYYQGMILPAAGSFFLTLIVCTFTYNRKWLYCLWLVVIGIGMNLSMRAGFVFSLELSLVFYGLPSGFIAGCFALGNIFLEFLYQRKRNREEKIAANFEGGAGYENSI